MKAEILQDGQPRECAYRYYENELSVTVAAFARRVDGVFEDTVGFGPAGFEMNGDRFNFGLSGKCPRFLMTEITEPADEGIGTAIVPWAST